MESHLEDDDFRRMAKARVKFRMSLATYVIVNAFLIGVWFFTRDADDVGRPWWRSFWPGWVLLGWGIGLAFQAWHAYGGAPDAVAREEQKLREKYGRQ